MLEEKGGNGFPHLVFLDASGDVLAVHDGPRTADAFRETAGKARDFVRLRVAAAGGDRQAKLELLEAELGVKKFTAEDLDAALKDLGELSAEEHTRLWPKVADSRVKTILEGVTDQNEETQEKVAQKFLTLRAESCIPGSDETLAVFWMILLEHADHARDVPLFEEGLSALKARFADNPRAQKFLAEQEKKLEALKAPTVPDEENKDAAK